MYTTRLHLHAYFFDFHATAPYLAFLCAHSLVLGHGGLPEYVRAAASGLLVGRWGVREQWVWW
jgi:hypothetical protein